MFATILCNILLLNTALAAPLKPSISEASLIKVAPSTASCSGADFPAECATASTAQTALQASFKDYEIVTFHTQAALVSLMLYESGDFKYNKNHWPGTPGQGTRNMMSPTFVQEYAEWLAVHMPKKSGITAANLATAKASGPAAVLELVNKKPENQFGSAAWYMIEKCPQSVRDGLAAGTQEGWSTYITSCVGTTLTADRTAIYEKVMALGHW